LWRSSQIKEETWERELEMRKKYPKIFSDAGMGFNFKDDFFFFKGECKTLVKILV
jgi:hypothetical protein